MRVDVALEGLETENGLIVKVGALSPASEKVPICAYGNWNNVIGMATNFVRRQAMMLDEMAVLSCDFELHERYSERDMEHMIPHISVLFTELDSEGAIVKGVITNISISAAPSAWPALNEEKKL